MILVLSPAKTLDFETPPQVPDFTLPPYLDQSALLVERLRQMTPADLSRLMGISDALAALNTARFQEWSPEMGPEAAKQAILAFNGDVYEGLAAAALSPEDLAWAQDHVRILSGLYGLLRPLDRIRPYRLEMGIRLDNLRGKDLYAFWGDQLTLALNDQLAANQDAPVLINLASEEYFKAVRPKLLKADILNCVFEDWKGGKYKIISFYAKRARGLMARHIVTHRLTRPEGLQSFTAEGYAFVPEVSDAKTYVFRRRLPEVQ